jgi:hypothetical protein
MGGQVRTKHGPEFAIQAAIIEFLRTRGWHTERLIGNAFQSGLPDLVAFHRKWGQRFIEVKNAGRYSFTRAQKAKFPVLESFGVGIWILTAADQIEYDKLFAPPNWRDYVKKTWHIPTQAEIDQLLDEIE